MSRTPYPPNVRQRAWELYFEGRKTLRATSEELGVPYNTVHYWHTKERWASRRKQLPSEMYDDWRLEWQQGIARERAQFILRLFRISEELHAETSRQLAAAVAPAKVVAIAKACKLNSDMIWPYVETFLYGDSGEASPGASVRPLVDTVGSGTPEEWLMGALLGWTRREIAGLWKPAIKQPTVRVHLQDSGWEAIQDVLAGLEEDLQGI